MYYAVGYMYILIPALRPYKVAPMRVANKTAGTIVNKRDCEGRVGGRDVGKEDIIEGRREGVDVTKKDVRSVITTIVPQAIRMDRTGESPNAFSSLGHILCMILV